MHEKNHKNKTFAWDIIGIAIGSMLFFLWHSMHLYGLRWDYDEGAYLASAQLLWHGYELYGEVYATHPPIFFYTLALAFLSPANVLWFGRFIIVLHATIGLIATSLIARRIGAKWHGLTCLIILALQPQIFRNARLINGNVPSLSIAMLALWASLEFYHTGKNRWLVMAGISMAWAIGIKFLVLYLTPLPILLIALRAIHHEKEFFACAKTIIKNSFAWGIIVVMTFFIIILPFDKTAIFSQTVDLIIKGQTIALPYPNWQIIMVALFSSFAGLSLLAITGIALLWQKQSSHAIFMMSWLILTFIALLNHAPLWEHFFTTLSYPFAILGSFAIWYAIKHLQDIYHGRGKFQRWHAINLAGMAWLLISLPGFFAENYRNWHAPTHPNDVQTIAYLKANVPNERFVITDEQLLTVMANKLIPPNLTDTSGVRIGAGELTTSQMIALTKSYRPIMIVIGREGRFRNGLPEYVTWVEEHYDYHDLGNAGNKIFVERLNE